MLGARVVLTDLPEALDILRHNVDRCFTPDALAQLRYGLADCRLTDGRHLQSPLIVSLTSPL